MSIFSIFRRKKVLDEPWDKYYTKEELNIKIPDISIYEQARLTSEKFPKNTAIKYLNKKINYKNMLKNIDIIANSFYDLGLRKGNIVTVLLPNIPEVLFSLYGLNKIGAIANMTHPLSSKDEIKNAVASTQSKIIIVYIDMLDKVKDLLDTTSIEKIIYVSPVDSLSKLNRVLYKLKSEKKIKPYLKEKRIISWLILEQTKNYNEDIDYKKYGRDTPAVILHSGGTSGKSKNVVLQNRALILAAKQESIALRRLRSGDSCLAIMPNFHGFGLSILMHTPLTLGCHTILVPRFSAKTFDLLLKKEKPTCILGVPTLFEALISKDNKKLDLSFIKYVISGGDILSKKLETRVNAYLKEHGSSATIIQGYGLTEALAAVSIAPDNLNRSGSCGIPLPGNNIKIIDSGTRKTVPYGQIGEIVVHTKALMMGYLNEESETNDALQIHDDGHIWLHTGDLGYMDEDGFLYYKGRIKRMIITSGYNVYPSYIEEVIEKHPAILQCSVVGVPHPYKHEVPKAFIVLNDGYSSIFIKNEIKEFCKSKLSKYMIPTEIVIRKKLPKTKLGKVDFRKLQEDAGDDEYE